MKLKELNKELSVRLGPASMLGICMSGRGATTTGGGDDILAGPVATALVVTTPTRPEVEAALKPRPVPPKDVRREGEEVPLCVF